MATASPSRSAPRRPKPPRAAERTRRARANTRLNYDILGISLVAFGLLLLGTLILPGSQSGGNVVGTAIVRGLRLLVGCGAWAFPFVLMTLGGMLAIGRSRSWDNAGATLGLFAVFLGWWHLGHVGGSWFFVRDNLLQHGGYLGAVCAWGVHKLFGSFGAHIAFFAMAVVGGLYLTDIPLPSLLGPIERLLGRGAAAGKEAAVRSAIAARTAAHAKLEQKRSERQMEREVPAARKPATVASTTPRPKLFVRPVRESATDEETSPTIGNGDVGDDEPTPVDPGTPIAVQPSLFLVRRSKPVEVEKSEKPRSKAAPEPAVDSDEEVDAVAPSIPEPALARRSGKAPVFALPSTSLLRAPDPAAPTVSGVSDARRQTLLETLEDFGIGADIAEVAYGPTVTRYEVALERGIKVSKIVSLADNLAMALAAIDVRVEAPIPGKSAIGIEVPNEKPQLVTLRECLETNELKNAPGRLTFALGKDVTGKCRYADLAKMPHLLIAGATGAGKSAGINSLISSLLFRNTPRELKFLMIDPKKVELSLYDGIPHLASPVITNVKQAPSLFKQAIREMEQRYDKFARLQTRNLEGYNSKVEEEERLPYWVIVVDELADLMMTSGPEIEGYICRLAQLARATGIHLVIATQRPSVNVITGTIKANIPSRIAFAMNSAVDSRTIIDQVGADRLIGRGDMLYMPMDAAKPMRLQGCFVSEAETEALVKHLRAQGMPNFEVLPSSLSLATGEDDSGEAEPDDELFEQAVRLVVTGGSASTSMLQRRFKIGYTRAARLVDMMELKGIVGALDGAKPREILISRDDIDQMFMGQSGIE